MRLYKFLLIIFSPFICQNFAYSQYNSYRSELGFVSDNDAYLAIGQDQYYTNGLFLHFRRAAKINENKNPKISKKIWELRFGQQMYNASSGYAPVKQLIDRPFAGYLFGSYASNWLFTNEQSLKAEIQVGTIGKSSLAEKSQKLYHQAFGFYDIDGWEYQIQSKLGINIKVSYLLKLAGKLSKKTDLSFPTTLSIGNYFSGLDAGLLFRTGKISPLNNSIATNSSISNKEAYPGELYFFLKPKLSWVAYNATISGSMLGKPGEDEVTFDSKPLVFSQELGLAYSKERLDLGFSLIFKTKEIESNAKTHQYGSIKVSYKLGKTLNQ